MSSGPSLRERILAAKDLTHKEVQVPEWGPKGEPLVVRVALMSGLERDLFERWLDAGGEKGHPSMDVVAKVLCLTLRDDQDQLIFKPEELEVIKAKSSPVLMRIYDEAVALNKIGLRTLEAEEGKSVGVPGDSSRSA